MQYHYDKFTEVINIKYQTLTHKHVSKKKSKIGKITFKILETKVKSNVILWDQILVSTPMFLNNDMMTTYGSYYVTLSAFNNF